jgi:hypothetical protein
MSFSDDMYSIENHPLMIKYINHYKLLKERKFFHIGVYWNTIASLIIAPFYTISISRQLSVTPNKEIYGDYVEPKKSKELTKISSEVTLREAKNFELIKSSGVLEGQKPYRAPIYDNYWQTIKGLYRQGILAFYKGNFYRLFTYFVVHRFKISMNWYLKDTSDFLKRFHLLREWISLTIGDMLLHPLFMLENRLILQNRLPQFQFYNNFFKFHSRSYSDMYKGFLGHMPKNFLFLGGFYFCYSIPSYSNLAFATLFGGIISYPIVTPLRRLVCESSTIPGLLPLRYMNLMHAFFLIIREEGIFRGLYKGFFSYLIGLCLWAIIVPSNTLINYNQIKLKEDEQMFSNDPVFEEIKKRKINNLKN